MNGPLLPSELDILASFLTLSSELTVRATDGRTLFRVQCPALRLKKEAFVYAGEDKRETLFWMCPVWGLDWNVQLNLGDDEILGVLQRGRNEKTDRPEWRTIDAFGREMVQVRPVGTPLQRLSKRLSLFSETREELFLGARSLGSFTRRAGVVNSACRLRLESEVNELLDTRFVLAAAIGLTGLFDGIFG